MPPIRGWQCGLHRARIATRWWAAPSLFPLSVARGIAFAREFLVGTLLLDEGIGVGVRVPFTEI